MADHHNDTYNVEVSEEERAKDNNKKREEEKEMTPTSSNAMHRSGSRPQLDLSGAAIQGNFEERNPTILLPNQSDDISHLALDIGGSLIKLVYFSRHEEQSYNDKRKRSIKKRFGMPNGNRRSYPILGGRLHFVKFETGKLNECLDFIASKQLHRGGEHNALLFHCIDERSGVYRTVSFKMIRAKRNTLKIKGPVEIYGPTPCFKIQHTPVLHLIIYFARYQNSLLCFDLLCQSVGRIASPLISAF